MFATLGHDKSVFVYRISTSESGAAPAGNEGDAAGGGGAGGAAGGEGLVVEVLRKKDLVSIPEAACFLDDGNRNRNRNDNRQHSRSRVLPRQ